ncbi:MAG TPA: prephenate dehydrogenase/arogenate dehydrogenase family protein, partial [Candidatus Paceibacterota bacterium]|nr:prephenate dehydrogenase/arogenate dehydrogenase family protein [Candidatus Paceibacterota bacterium]
IVTDVGSAKAIVVKDVCDLIRKAGAHFIGSHPMAGAEKTGVAAARENLFENAVCVLTPTKNSNPAALRKVEQFWKSLGGRTVRLTPQLHDQLVSRSSHLPHIVAAALANLVLNPANPKMLPQLCATGFRDTTRIASGSPEMWRDIALANRKNVSRSADVFVAELKKFKSDLNRGDAKAVGKFFVTAKERRDNWCANAGSTSSE